MATCENQTTINEDAVEGGAIEAAGAYVSAPPLQQKSQRSMKEIQDS